MSKDFFWCDKLAKANAEIIFNKPSEAEDLTCKSCVMLKQVILGPVENTELNVIEFYTTGFDNVKKESVLCCLQASSERKFDQQSLDVTFMNETKMKLVRGSGPVTLLGQYMIDFVDIPEDEDEDEEEVEESDFDANEEEDIDEPSPVVVSKKRKPARADDLAVAPKENKKMKKEKPQPMEVSSNDGKKGKGAAAKAPGPKRTKKT